MKIYECDWEEFKKIAEALEPYGVSIGNYYDDNDKITGHYFDIDASFTTEDLTAEDEEYNEG